ncbi:hypothetical protein [Polluticoccus soli]|uniref:hypothetical protein n=1 Tax=Polluticoccus soli TaxID=3034150 RepID=UPI0023E12011|nr:hypothetical protein [Flavipsychrobacter sp. JY13-12]
MNFNEYHWHDSIIENIQIDRSNPGKEDTIKFEIEWSESHGKSVLSFEEVYWAMFNLNFGIIASETILDACQLDDNNEDLVNFYSNWKGLMNSVPLKTFHINLNSTGSLINIIARRFTIDKT